MFSIFISEKKRKIDYSKIGVDMHSHLIPAIDDGAKNLEESLTLIKGLVEMGFSKIITTPHIMNEYYPNTPEIIRSGLDVLRQATEQAGVEVEIAAAAEYFIDETFEALLQSKAPLLCFGKKHILVEQSMLFPTNNLQQVLFLLNTQGYQPIVAHPERYIYYANDFKQFDILKSYGCRFQLNLLSLAGYYGKPQQQLALKLLRANMIDFVGTDLHHQRHLQALQQFTLPANLQQYFEEGAFGNDLLK